MSRSAKDALVLARTCIENARNAQGSESKVIEQYRTAKNALAGVDVAGTSNGTFREMIDAFEELAIVLDHTGGQSREKATKCRRRAEKLRKIPATRMSIHTAVASSSNGPAFPLTIALAGADHLKSLLSSDSTASTTQQPSPPSLLQSSLPAPRLAISSSAAGSLQQLFDRDVNPLPFTIHLPGPGETLQTTHQLAYCLALFQASAQKDDLALDALKWRRSTLDNAVEKERLETMSIQILEAFAGDVMKEAATVAEVTQLAPVLNNDHSRFLLKTFIDTVNQSEILNLHSLEGLAKTTQGSTPGSIDSGDLVTIIRCLHRRLGSTHSASHHNHYLLLAISRVLDAMADAHIRDVDRVNLHGPLTDLLRESESSHNPYLTFQAAYATQALLNVSDDEGVWHAGFRRVWLVLKVGVGFAKMPDPTEIKDALEGLERLYEVGKGGTRLLKDSLNAIKNHDRPTFTVKEGLKFKRAWYRALRMAESYIQSGRLVKFKDLITTAPCRDQLMFQWGICQLLGEFAADTQWELEARQDAVVCLGVLYRTDEIWIRKKEVDQVIFDVLTDLASINGMDFKAAKTLLDEMANQNTTLKSITSRSTNPTVHTVPGVKLLKTVQDQSRRNTKLENIPDLPISSNLNDVHSALKAYHAPDLFILRVSGKKLDLETCFVNLAIVEAPAHREMEKRELQEQAAIFHRITSFERVKNANTKSLIPLEQLFDKRKLRNGKEDIPRKILVQGRAGIGKTTLCKKLVHLYQRGLWKDLFEAVLWIPLRQLRGFKRCTLEDLFCEKVFTTQNRVQHQVALAEALVLRAERGKVLFILDGLDEIISDIGSEDNKTFRTFLKSLLEQHYVVITSRPSGVDSRLLPEIDLDLETVGFSQQNVKDFIVKVLDPDAASTVQDFIQQTPLIQGLVNIPVQLDVVCFSWHSLPIGGKAITMTGLYQLMVRELWRKDALRLKKTAGGHSLMEKDIQKLKARGIDRLMATELQHLGYLAFKGMNNHHQIEFDEDALLCAFEDLEEHSADSGRLLPPQLVKVMKQTSFLHTADADPDSQNSSSQQAWHFLHLTFQEYFAATWIVRHFHLKQQCFSPGMMTMEEVTAFVHQNKYNPQYEIVWSMVAGLLEIEPLKAFFRLFQGAPRDLIGGRHQQILASCLNETRARLEPKVVARLDSELMGWLGFEMQTCQHGQHSKSMLGSQISFPEDSLAKAFASLPRWKITLMNTLATRSALSDSTLQLVIFALVDKDAGAKSSAASALDKQSKLPESAILSLIAALKEGDGDVRSLAAKALGKQSELPESAVISLIAALSDKYWGVRTSAEWALARQSTFSESTILSLIAALKDVDARFMAESVLAKQSVLPESAMQVFITVLNDQDESVRSSAARVLHNQAMLSELVDQPLIAALKGRYKDVRSSAAKALGNRSTLPEAAIQALILALQDENDDVRSSATEALGKQSALPDSALQALTTALKDKNEDVRSSAAGALGNQSTLPESAIQSLTTALQDKYGDVRSSAAEALGNYSTLSESAIQSLTAALKDKNEDVRSSAAQALSKQSMLPESAIRVLVAAVKDEKKYVRSSAAKALGNQSTLPESAIQSLTTALQDKDGDVRYSAAEALGKQSTLPKSAIQVLVATVKDEKKYVRSSAAKALGNQSTLSESAIQSLTTALQDKDGDVRSSAAEAIGNHSTLSESATQILVATVQDEDENVQSSAAEVLDNYSEFAFQPLIDALQDKHGYIRYSAAKALSKQSMLPESAIRVLVATVKNEEAYVRSSAAKALGNQSTLPESAIQSLTTALQDKDGDVRYSAAEALGKQSTLTKSAIQSLIGLLSVEEDVRRYVSAALQNHLPSLCNSLPHLTEDELACLYEYHLFNYSCNHVLSLQVQNGRMQLYTEQGAIEFKAISDQRQESILSAFTGVQRKARLTS